MVYGGWNDVARRNALTAVCLRWTSVDNRPEVSTIIFMSKKIKGCFTDGMSQSNVEVIVVKMGDKSQQIFR